MDVLNIMQCTNLGGTERGSFQFMAGLQKRRHSCRVLSLHPLGRFTPILRDQGIVAEGLPYLGKGGVLSAPLLHRKLRTIQADAVIMTGHNLLAMACLGDLCKGRRVLSMHYHHTGAKAQWQWRLIYQLARRKFQAITFNSDFIRREAESICPSITSISQTIRYPITIPAMATDEEKTAARQSLGIDRDAMVIGNASWLIRRKRLDVFLNVAAKIINLEQKVVFVIAGDGPERAVLQGLAHRLGIADRIHWLGWQEDTRKFYLCVDALLFNSDWDAVPMTVLEAMSYGIPVVASILNGGLKEILVHGEHGFLFSTHDIDALANSAMMILKGNGRELAMAGRQRIKECCNFENCVTLMERLLERENTRTS